MAQKRLEAFHHLLAVRQVALFIHPASWPLFEVWAISCKLICVRSLGYSGGDPWAIGKHQLTKAYMLCLAHWARKLSWQETAVAFRSTWDKVCKAVEYVVEWGLEHRNLGPIQAIGVDEIQYAKGHKYLTLVYQIEKGV